MKKINKIVFAILACILITGCGCEKKETIKNILYAVK